MNPMQMQSVLGKRSAGDDASTRMQRPKVVAPPSAVIFVRGLDAGVSEPELRQYVMIWALSVSACVHACVCAHSVAEGD
jgi:hypothetical protein